MANRFVRDELAHCSYDTMFTSPFVLSYYINGRDNFIHVNPSRGYFATQRGTAYLIFQTRRPGQGKLLEERWNAVAADSIVSYDFKGPDFTLTEIVCHHYDYLGKKQGNHLIPMLTSYSVETYRKWGLGDSAEVSMQQFLKHDAPPGQKLFEKITSIHLVITQKELRDLIPVLQLAGYRKNKNRFVKAGDPKIFYSIRNDPSQYKVRKLTLELSRDADKQIFHFDNMSLRIKRKKAEFSFE